MKVGIFGTGDVGRALGKAFITLGHEVMLGSRSGNNEKATAWAAEMGERARTGTFADAAAFGEIIVLATLGVGTESALASAGSERAPKKVATAVIDLAPGRSDRREEQRQWHLATVSRIEPRGSRRSSRPFSRPWGSWRS